MVEGEVIAASKGWVVYGQLGWWIRLVGDEMGGRTRMDMSSEEVYGGEGAGSVCFVLARIDGGTFKLGV